LGTVGGIGIVTATTAIAADDIAIVTNELNLRMAALDRLVNTFTLEAQDVPLQERSNASRVSDRQPAESKKRHEIYQIEIRQHEIRQIV